MKHYQLILFLLIVIGLYSCDAASAQQGGKKITNAELINLMKAGEIQLIDVRTPAEVMRGKIEGSVNIDYLQSDFTDKLKKLDKEKPVVVYCAVGGRSAKATDKLEQLGFKTIYDLSGGIRDWEKQGHPVVK